MEMTEKMTSENRELCERFPFLRIEHRDPEYDDVVTMLDFMPTGWRKAFGEQMCQEIMDELVANDMVDDYHVDQIKEKYGGLRWYDNGFTEKGREIIDKYEALSYKTCIRCGKKATRVTCGWIAPYCDDCCPLGRSEPLED